eukprot:8330872-Pyramimonas_sp.AAC.1
MTAASKPSWQQKGRCFAFTMRTLRSRSVRWLPTRITCKGLPPDPTLCVLHGTVVSLRCSQWNFDASRGICDHVL